MPLQATSGAASYDAFGGGAAAVPTFVEDIFSTYLYTGNGSTQNIVNGVDLSTKGGLVWVKSRAGSIDDHILVDTARGTLSGLRSNLTNAASGSGGFTSFNTDGFSFDSSFVVRNDPSTTYVSWTFRKQPKFFDVVTYTGNGVDDRQIAHSLGSTPGCVMIKRTDTTGAWAVSHNYDFGNVLFLNTTAAAIANPASNGYFGYPANPLQPTYFTLGTNAATNASGGTYVAYIFASDSGGFGLTGTDNVISCGSYTGNGAASNPITLGYEPQWVLLKRTDITGDWGILDTMRGWSYGDEGVLKPNTSGATDNGNTEGNPTATGFDIGNGNYNVNTRSYIYIAIRRGPMKVPTSGTSVFKGTTYSGTGSIATISGVGFSPDMVMTKPRSPDYGYYGTDYDRLRGVNRRLSMNVTNEEQTVSGVSAFNMDGYSLGIDGNLNNSESIYVSWSFLRSPSFFDEVCYTGTGSATTVTHNLTVVPELMIVKNRTTASYSWFVYSATLGNSERLLLNTTAASAGTFAWDYTSPTSSVFTVGTSGNVNESGSNYVAYLFATCAGVSKVGSYTGTGGFQFIDCGFTAGSRFIMIKRTDAAGDWYVWDSARGINPSGTNDPYLLLNSTAAEVTSTDLVSQFSTGFIVQAGLTAINANGGTYIFLAIA